MSTHVADDLFAGAGGWDLAAQALGIHARGVENMPAARETRDAAGLTTIHDDVWTFTPDGHAAGLIASPPCQTFSAAGKGSGRKALDDVLAVIASGDWHSLAKLKEAGLRFGDDRTALVLTPLHFATGYEYEWLAWEQVPAVLPVWEACAEVLRSLGWNVWTGLLQAEMYGVPQTRKRAFLLASLNGPVSPPAPTHSRYYSRSPEKLDEGVEKWVSMAEALGWGLPGRPSPTVTGGGTETGGAEPIAKLARYTEQPDFQPRDVEYVNGTHDHAARRPADRPAPTVMFGARSNKVEWVLGTTNVKDSEYHSRPADAPAPTITAAARSFRWGEAPLLVTTPGVKGGNMQENRVTADEFPTHMGDVYNSKGCIRSTDEPAPTMTASMGNGNFRWHSRCAYCGEMRMAERCDVYVCAAFEAGPTPAIDGETADDLGWVHGRPSPTVVGTFAPDVVAAPGYRKPGDPPRQKTPGSVRVTVQEAGVLQSFPADYPWQGTKGKQYLQCGNAVPPRLAFHALGAAAVHHLTVLTDTESESVA